MSGSKEGLAVQLAREIEQAAESEIASKGVFHLAFSGGTTPVLLWQTLAQSFASEYWAHVHVWQVVLPDLLLLLPVATVPCPRREAMDV